MPETVLLASHIATILIGAGGSLAIVRAAARGRVGTLTAVGAVLLLLPLAASAGAAQFAILPGGSEIAHGVQSIASASWFAAFPLLAATFPDGRFVPRWSRWFVLGTSLVALAELVTGGALSGLDSWWMYALAQGVVCIALVASRYRVSRSTPERESVRWVFLGTLVTATAFLLIMTTTGTIGGPGPLRAAAANAALAPIMLGLVIGVLRPRLWNVDAAFRIAVFAMIAGWTIFGLHALAFALAGSTAAVVVVAVVTAPVVWFGWRAATWLVYRNRLGPDAAVRRLAAALDADSPEPIAGRVAAVTAAATGSPAVGIESRVDADRGVFDVPSSDLDDAEGFPISFRSEVLATLRVAPRQGESRVNARDRDAVQAIARHAAPALHGARALFEATAARSALVSAREEERRRLRRDLHDDLGPALSGLALGAAALAKNADAVDAGLAAEARELQRDIQNAVEQTREISHGLRPPILDDRGLVAAIRSRVLAQSSPHLAVLLEAGSAVGELPAAVDLAALRIVQEAVANVRRHARATTCTVVLAREGHDLRVDIADDGIGVGPAIVPGVGLRSIRARASELGGRARVGRRERGGTIVSVWLPLGDAQERTAS